ncbi:MAG: nucleotide exchange factor GrpE [Armatimonadota bacterium]|nr:nucleotide exchange factor GrpE [Armatimonadota bacterium]MDR7438986.1 nucleotide exchange factor GrpE [Armatimonadota bacterium]MDR7563274.1 nucleotide exchange factor GrpE [Armatimonadota bacterium]MDR7566968.1 nucleotide exchange factor GrpE [Armatimonadota bacterium]MDR7602061.1 nucleotide exchange factor GrpE [Armatimonadota bacterium]
MSEREDRLNGQNELLGESPEAPASGGDGPAEPGAVQPSEPAEVCPEEVARLREEVARLREEAERNWQQFLHAAADLENYKKLAARRQEEAVARTRRAMLQIVLGVLDNLERAIRYGEQAQDSQGVEGILEGLRMTHRSVLEQLSLLGVRPMEAAGARFDPSRHEAVEQVSAAEAGVEPGTVVEVVQQGYLVGEEVLRPARVRVAQ